MSHRHLLAPLAAFAVGVAVTPGAAHAAASPSHALTSSTLSGAAATVKSKAAALDFKTYKSPASKSVRVQNPARGVAKGHTSSTGTTIYASSAVTCTTETGNGTQTSPYCNIQDAVNAAVAGDTVDVLGSTGYFSEAPVTVTTSNISIVGIGDQAWILPTNAGSGQPALVLNGVTGVTVSNMMLSSSNAATVQVINSSNVTIDSSYVDRISGSSTPTSAISIDGASSNVTVSRTYADTGLGSGLSKSHAISIASGAGNITLASDVVAASGIGATGVNGLKVVGDTIQRVCGSGIDIEGSSTGVSLENNLIEDANSSTDYAMGGFQSQCASAGQAWAPGITVSSGSSAATTADYNDFYIYGTDASAPYSWAGTSYPTLAAFQAAVPQGAHDLLDTKEAGGVYFRSNESDNVDAKLQPGSAAIGSANPSAPGGLSSDFSGVSPYSSRGAIQYTTPDPGLAVSLSAQATSALGFELTANVTSAGVALNATTDWGDNTTSNSSFTGSNQVNEAHSYAKVGTYAITFTVTDNGGDTVVNHLSVTTAGSDFTAYGPVRLLDTRTGAGTNGTVAKVAGGGTLHLQVSGAGTSGNTIPAGVTAVVLNLTVTNPAKPGYITAYPNQNPSGAGMSAPSTSNVNFGPGQTVPNLAIVPLGKDGVVDLLNGSTGATDLVADVTGYFTQTASSGYTSLAPDRLVDTRNGTGAAKAQVAKGGSIAVQIAGADGGQLPSSGVTAVALNVTVTNPKGAGFLTLYPDGASQPNASNLNFLPGQTVPNAAVVPVGSDGKIRVFNGSPTGATDVVIDVVGFYSAGSTSAYLPILPQRLLDTRNPSWPYGPLGKNSYIYMPLSPTDPSQTAFVLNTTVTNTRGPGVMTISPDPNSLGAYQSGTAVWPTPPNASSLNWGSNQTVPNLVQAAGGPNGIVDFWNLGGFGAIDVVVDAFGFYQNS